MTSGAIRQRPGGRRWRWALRWACAGLAWVLAGLPGSPRADEAETVDDLLSAVVALEARVPPSARTADILGTERSGAGVVIDAKGTVLTIGYLILEAREVRVTTSDGRELPAAVLGYDPYTGFGAVRPLAPLELPHARMGRTDSLSRQDPVLVVGEPGGERVRSVVVVSRRTFAGYWEYLLERAIFTSPPVEHFAGAGLFDRQLQLMGIGSLFSRDAEREMGLPGNMFVPVDEAPRVAADLAEAGRSSLRPRPWLGVNLGEIYDRVMITRVYPDSPAAEAGLQAGDIILEVDRIPVGSMERFYRAMWGMGEAGVVVPLTVLQKSTLHRVPVHTRDRYRYYRFPID